MSETEIISDAIGSGDWIRAAAIIVASLVIAFVTNRVVRRVLRAWIGAGFAALVTGRLMSYVVFLIGLFYALNTLGVRVGPLLGALGLGGIVIALALQKPVENFFAAITLQTLRPFTIGDTIRVGDHLGVVLDIDSRTTVLRGDDGTTISMPNSNVTAETTINLTREAHRRSTIVVGVAYDSELDVATSAIRRAVDRVPRVVDDPVPMVVLSDFASSSIEFNVLYWHPSDRPSERIARHDLMLAIHQELDRAGITIAFPQMVLWEGTNTGGPGYAETGGAIETAHPGLKPVQATVPRRPMTWRRGRRSSQ